MNDTKAGPGVSRPRRLLLCLDGVPHKIIESAKSRGLFAKFNKPSRLLSPFPTMTNVALSAMFKASPPPGYESLYFDCHAHSIQGGIRKYIGARTPDKIPSSYMDQIDYQEPLPFEFLIYVMPEKIWRADMRKFAENFRAAPQTRDYFAFLKGTDGLLHAQGPARLEIALESLDQLLTEIRDFCGNETEIILFSDHGMNLERNKRVSLVTQLQRCNFNVRTRLSGDGKREVSVPTFGLCSYAAIYCKDKSDAAEVARTVIDLPGVDFMIYKDGESVTAGSTSGSARIDRKKVDGNYFYRYQPIQGDPLLLRLTVNELKNRRELDANEFASDANWFEATKSHRYPDALANIYKSLFGNRVTNTADVLVSLQDGFYYGWSAFARIVNLVATHGNALQASSHAFMMSTHRELPSVIRADDASQFLRT